VKKGHFAVIACYEKHELTHNKNRLDFPEQEMRALPSQTSHGGYDRPVVCRWLQIKHVSYNTSQYTKHYTAQAGNMVICTAN